MLIGVIFLAVILLAAVFSEAVCGLCFSSRRNNLIASVGSLVGIGVGMAAIYRLAAFLPVVR